MGPSDLRERRALITGASGFVGSWLTEYLVDAGADVTVVLAEFNPDSPFIASGLVHKVRNVLGSVEDFTFLERAIGDHGIDSVFHLAAVATESRAFPACGPCDGRVLSAGAPTIMSMSDPDIHRRRTEAG